VEQTFCNGPPYFGSSRRCRSLVPVITSIHCPLLYRPFTQTYARYFAPTELSSMIRSVRLRPYSTSSFPLRRSLSFLGSTSQISQLDQLTTLRAVKGFPIKRAFSHSCLCTRATNRNTTISSIMSRRVASTKSDGKHEHGHTSTHKHAADEGCDHGHGGLFHTHVHDHSEGAQQLITALSAGRLDRGTKITLLGKASLKLS